MITCFSSMLYSVQTNYMLRKTCNLSFFLYKLHVFDELHLFAINYIFFNHYMFGVSSESEMTIPYST